MYRETQDRSPSLYIGKNLTTGSISFQIPVFNVAEID